MHGSCLALAPTLQNLLCSSPQTSPCLIDRSRRLGAAHGTDSECFKPRHAWKPSLPKLQTRQHNTETSSPPTNEPREKENKKLAGKRLSTLTLASGIAHPAHPIPTPLPPPTRSLRVQVRPLLHEPSPPPPSQPANPCAQSLPCVSPTNTARAEIIRSMMPMVWSRQPRPTGLKHRPRLEASYGGCHERGKPRTKR